MKDTKVQISQLKQPTKPGAAHAQISYQELKCVYSVFDTLVQLIHFLTSFNKPAKIQHCLFQ